MVFSDFTLFGMPSPTVMLLICDYLLLKNFAPVNISFGHTVVMAIKENFGTLYLKKKTLLCHLMVQFCR